VCTATGAGMVIKNKIKNKKVLIVGLGGVGLSSLLACIYFKNKEIDVVEKNLFKINFIKKKLLKNNINYIKDFNKVKKNYYDLIIETSGSANIISNSMNFIKKKGKIIFASHPKFNSKIKLDPFDLITGKKIYGTWGGNIDFNKDLKLLIKIIKSFKNLDKFFFNKIYKLNKINLAIKDFQKGKVIRPLIKF